MVSGDEASPAEARLARRPGWVEPSATLLIAVAAILTAWSAFQAAKWNGLQADRSREATAAGAGALRQTTIASTQKNIDVDTFLQWLQAVRDDIRNGLVDPAGPFVANPQTLSGFIALRFRPEFQPAFNAWLATRPLQDANAPATPFDMPQYSLAADAEVNRLNSVAQGSAAGAQTANGQAQDYVMMTVLLAVGLVFSGISSRLSRRELSILVFALACTTIIGAAITMATVPVRI